MITPKQLDAKVTEKYVALQLEAAEAQLDRELEEKWETSSTTSITVWFDPPVHRAVLDELHRRYSGRDKWDVELRSKDNSGHYDGLEMVRYSPPYTGGGRD